MSVAVAPIMEQPFADRIRAIAKFKPHLADATANFICIVMGSLAQGLEACVRVREHSDGDPPSRRGRRGRCGWRQGLSEVRLSSLCRPSIACKQADVGQ